MNSRGATELAFRLQCTIDCHVQEFDMSYEEVIGILETLKASFTKRYLEVLTSDTDDDDEQ